MKITANLWMKIGAAASAGVVAAAALFVGFHEGLVTRPYYDAVGVLTVCYGHTGATGKAIENREYSADECNALLEEDIKEAEAVIKRQVKVPLSVGQEIALISFIVNLGESKFASSTLLRKLNNYDYAGARDEFRRWVYAGGRVLKGLQDRRGDEAVVWDYEP